MAWIRKYGGWGGLIAANVLYLGILAFDLPINQAKIKVPKTKVIVNNTVGSDYEGKARAPTYYCKSGKHRYRCA